MNTGSSFAGIFRSQIGDGRAAAGLCGCIVALLMPVAGGTVLRDALRYDRAAIAAGEWPRLVTAHLVHLDLRHALLNAAGLVLLWALFARNQRALAWFATVVVSIIAIDAGLWWLQPDIHWYVGASGVVHGVFASGCLAMLRARDKLALFAGGVFVAKLLWEYWQGPLQLAGDVPVVTASHLYGAVGGALIGALWPRRL